MAESDIGSISKLFVTHTMSLHRGAEVSVTGLTTALQGAAPSTFADRFVALNSAFMGATYPRDRTNVGIDRIYFHAAPDIDVVFSVRATRDAVKNLFDHDSMQRPVSAGDGRGLLPYYWWSFQGTSPWDISEKSIVSFIAQAVGFGASKPSDDPTQTGNIHCRLRVTSDENQIRISQ